jgi:hypothetical protein
MFATEIFSRKETSFHLSGHVDRKKKSEYGREIIRMQRNDVRAVLYPVVMWKDRMRHFYSPTSAVIWMN